MTTPREPARKRWTVPAGRNMQSPFLNETRLPPSARLGFHRGDVGPVEIESRHEDDQRPHSLLPRYEPVRDAPRHEGETPFPQQAGLAADVGASASAQDVEELDRSPVDHGRMRSPRPHGQMPNRGRRPTRGPSAPAPQEGLDPQRSHSRHGKTTNPPDLSAKTPHGTPEPQDGSTACP